MKTKAFVIMAVGSVSLLSADPYYQSSCPNGNCAYQGQSSGQGYYPQASGQAYYQGQGQQGQGQGYYQGQGRQQGQGYYQGQGQQGYNQNPNQQYNQGNVRHNQSQNANQDRDGYNNSSSNWNNPNTSNNWNNSNPNNADNNSNWNSSNNSNWNNNNDKNNPRVSKVVSDEEIAKQVHDAVSSNWLSSGYPDVTFDVNNGSVNLRGTVKTLDEKTKLENAVKKIDGVKNVNNEVNVGDAKTASNANKNSYLANTDTKMRKTETTYPQDTAASDSDRVINSKIRNKLSGWFTNGYETVVLNTTNGIVTITGNVEKTDDIQKVNKDVKAIDGVKSVNNNVTVQKR